MILTVAANGVGMSTVMCSQCYTLRNKDHNTFLDGRLEIDSRL